jgi:hypothetical protein
VNIVWVCDDCRRHVHLTAMFFIFWATWAHQNSDYLAGCYLLTNNQMYAWLSLAVQHATNIVAIKCGFYFTISHVLTVMQQILCMSSSPAGCWWYVAHCAQNMSYARTVLRLSGVMYVQGKSIVVACAYDVDRCTIRQVFLTRHYWVYLRINMYAHFVWFLYLHVPKTR